MYSRIHWMSYVAEWVSFQAYGHTHFTGHVRFDTSFLSALNMPNWVDVFLLTKCLCHYFRFVAAFVERAQMFSITMLGRLPRSTPFTFNNGAWLKLIRRWHADLFPILFPPKNRWSRPVAYHVARITHKTNGKLTVRHGICLKAAIAFAFTRAVPFVLSQMRPAQSQ